MSGRLFDSNVDKVDDDLLVRKLIVAQNDGRFLFPFLLFLAGDNRQPHFLEAAELIIQRAFVLCFKTADLRPFLVDSVIDTLCKLSHLYPPIISKILKQSRSNFLAIQEHVYPLLLKLPWSTWPPDMDDIRVIENMLKDPLDSINLKVGKHIMEQIQWEQMSPFNPNEPLVPLVCQRRIAIQLVNIHLDSLGKAKSRNSIFKATTLVAKGALGVARDYAPMLPKLTDEPAAFSSWCWYIKINPGISYSDSSSIPLPKMKIPIR